MIHYLYTLDYYDGSEMVDHDFQIEELDVSQGGTKDVVEWPLMVNAQVYVIADKYGIETLKLLAACKFIDLVVEHEANEAFIEVIRHVYSSTPATDRGLRDPVCDAAFSNIERLISTPGFISVMEEVEGLSIELLRMSVSKNSQERRGDFGLASPTSKATEDDRDFLGRTSKKKRKALLRVGPVPLV
ncbi:MAG: hypothetical protein M1813_007535 [Trichoglossum hirsutum]|nr:MAG: hypothetical protein M1813_007535 [Trichoglossum hirsutum]